MHWLAPLRSLPLSRLFVRHEPETARYQRCRQKLDYLVSASRCLGERPADAPGAVEVAFWAPRPDGRKPGYYWCARLSLDDESVAVLGVIFCFWDGTEGSRGFGNVETAAAFARDEGFGGIDD